MQTYLPRGLGLALLALTICGRLTVRAAEPAVPAGPNILFVLADDMGWPDLRCYGHAWHETPVLDQLAAEGMRFTDFYAATPVCSSTRSTIQTGQYSARTAITDFIPGHWRPFEKLVVPPIEPALRSGVRTPGDVLQAAGYITGYFGKWHLGNTREEQPDRRGYAVTERQLGETFRQWRGDKLPGPKRIDLLTDQALWFLEQHADQPFFLTLSHHSVHIPIEARPGTRRKYDERPRPATGVNNPAHAAMVEDLDQSVGRLLKRLDELGLRERTLVVFSSDNGGLVRNYLGVGDAVSTNAPLRDEKGTLYEGGIRVPLIVRWPGVVSAGTECAEPATTADLLPTLCASVGVPLPGQTIDGTSLLPLWRDPATGLARDAIYFHYPHYHHSRPAGAIRVGPWKLIEFFEDGRLELYHLGRDLGETTDLSVRFPGRARDMQQRLAAWRESVGARMPTPNPKHDPERAQEWWNRNRNEPLNVQAVGRQLSR